MADHVVSVLLAEDLGGDRLDHEPMQLRQPAQIGGRMRIAQRRSQHEILALAGLAASARDLERRGATRASRAPRGGSARPG